MSVKKFSWLSASWLSVIAIFLLTIFACEHKPQPETQGAFFKWSNDSTVYDTVATIKNPDAYNVIIKHTNGLKWDTVWMFNHWQLYFPPTYEARLANRIVQLMHDRDSLEAMVWLLHNGDTTHTLIIHDIRGDVINGDKNVIIDKYTHF